jgi:hypothetical protein
LGCGFTGGTWAYERADQSKEVLSYREWRAYAGWESTPPKPPGTFMPTGTTVFAELGYVFGREFEFDSGAPDLSIEDTALLRAGISF